MNGVTASIVSIGFGIARIGVDLLTGKRDNVDDAIREIAGHLFEIVPVEQLREHLAEIDRIAIDAAADIAEEKVLKERGLP